MARPEAKIATRCYLNVDRANAIAIIRGAPGSIAAEASQGLGRITATAINPERFALVTMDLEPSIQVDSRVVRCDGGGGTLGHPAVFLNMGEDDDIVCPYCSRHFVLAEGAEPAAGH